MTDPTNTPAQHPGDSTVPLVPDGGYRQPEVPPLEDSGWPDFSYDDPGQDPVFGASDPFAATAPLTSPATASYSNPAPTAPLPYVSPQLPTNYQQPAPQRAYPPQPPPSYPPPTAYAPQPAYQPEPPLQPQREPAMYETYQPYTPPAPAPYTYPLTLTAAPEHPSAVTSLVLGILGLFVLPILAPVAWVIAGRARRDLRQYPGRWAPSGSLTAGYVLGIIGSLAWILFAALIVLFMALAMTSWR
jgi:hypothetical protein